MKQHINRQLTTWLAAAMLGIGLMIAGCGRPGAPASDQNLQSGDMSPSGALKNGVRVVEVKARRYEFDPGTIVVKQGEKVRLEVTSEDVDHGISIPGYDIDQELPPKKTETIEFTADKAGTFPFHCSVYCGGGHSKMVVRLVVTEK